MRFLLVVNNRVVYISIMGVDIFPLCICREYIYIYKLNDNLIQRNCAGMWEP